MYEKLGLKGAYPKSYAYWMQKVEKFYTELAASPEFQSELARLKISVEDINDRLLMIREVESLPGATQLAEQALVKLTTVSWYACISICVI